MQPSAFPPVHEPLAHTLRRNVAIALGAGVVVALLRERLALALPTALLALWFSLGGHYVEVFFLNWVRARIPSSGLVQRSVRVAVWFIGGAALYVLMTASARLFAMRFPSVDRWWLGALAFIAIELVVHATLALRRLPNFYRGDRSTYTAAQLR